MYSTYCRLGLHVAASWRDVVRATNRKIVKKHRRDPQSREGRKKFYRIMLQYHSDARTLFCAAMRGGAHV